jgi:hypothetical protein
MTQLLRLGTGAGFSADRLDPACELIKQGNLDYIIFECIGERTLAFGHRDRRLDPDKGYNPLLERRFEAILPLCVEHSTQVITNMGVANPRSAAHHTLKIARKWGLKPFRIAYIEGDEVTELVTAETFLPELGYTATEVGLPLVGANAYVGVEALLPALAQEADVIITGRVADPSLFLAPMIHTFKWQLDDWQRLGAGALIGHLMECGAQVTGGYFADPGLKSVEKLAYVGFPLAEIDPDGSAVITKLPDAGGAVTLRTVKEQLLYEIHDPSAYLTPDVVADFSTTQLAQAGPDRVKIWGATGRPRPAELKVTIAFEGGFLTEAEISYAGPGAQERANLAGQIIQERMTHLHKVEKELRIDLIGVNSLHSSAVWRSVQTEDVRLRAALRSPNRNEAELLLWEVESLLCCGPAGGGGFRGHLTPGVITHSAFVPRDQVELQMEMLET